MIFWIFSLYLIGSLLIVWGVVGGVVEVVGLLSIVSSWSDLYRLGLSLLYNLALALVCFGVAAGLSRLRKMRSAD